MENDSLRNIEELSRCVILIQNLTFSYILSAFLELLSGSSVDIVKALTCHPEDASEAIGTPARERTKIRGKKTADTVLGGFNLSLDKVGRVKQRDEDLRKLRLLYIHT